MNEISIIMPVYNKERYVCEILEDIENQFFSNFECIIIDDGSTDNSGNLCDKKVYKDSRFIVIHIPHEGVSHARNIGLKKATGKYIIFIDADDRINPLYLQQLYEAAVFNQADMVISGYEKFWIDSKKRKQIKLPYSGFYQMEKLLPEFARTQKETGVYGFCCGKLVKNQLLSRAVFDESIKLAEDFDFYLQVYPYVQTVYFKQDCFYGYLQNAENSSAIINDNQIDYFSQIYINLRYREFLKRMDAYFDENCNIVEKLINNYIFFSVFYSPRYSIKKNVNLIYKIITENKIELNSTRLFQRIVFMCINKNAGKTIEIIMQIYDRLRSALKGNE